MNTSAFGNYAKKIVVSLIYIVVVVFIALPLRAAPYWADNKVLKIGMSSNGTILIWMKDVERGNEKLFKIPQEKRQKEMLAKILTAISNDLVVRVYADFEETKIPTILDLYLMGE